ncbi:cbb3-type cytochrome c oxidase subunit III [Azomonas agilis]|uniref:Cbb3-type cytochrome c oxidase subunit III n=1 Tax=Azomonas agilis TaxID=116849 RepID=A0A562I0C8_9GAMM|nr:cytochrome c [Azomonas agilis]TWH64412.1 cbb3-type cytochrome c oxidase subunit III [Azomonas agilis]
MSTGKNLKGLIRPLLIVACMGASYGDADEFKAVGRCPEIRGTQTAPTSYLGRTNPLSPTAENRAAGARLYQDDARPTPCVTCHGVLGDGQGPAAAYLNPAPRNFRCRSTMLDIPDGQLYWVIEQGSGELHHPARQGAQHLGRPGRTQTVTAMRSYGDYLTEEEIWQLVLYIRSLANETD